MPPRENVHLPRRVANPPPNADLGDTARQAVFVGSSEHKNTPSFAGQPTPRSDASLCDPMLRNSRCRLTRALRQAIRDGQVGEQWEGEFPRYVWCRIDGTICEARLTNRGKGEYKGYPLEDEEVGELDI